MIVVVDDDDTQFYYYYNWMGAVKKKCVQSEAGEVGLLYSFMHTEKDMD